MTARRISAAALVAAVALVVVLLATGGDHAYVVKLRMANADGIKDGSPVSIGGVRVGKVDLDVSNDHRFAEADLQIDKRYGPVGRDASAAIVAQNLLGQKQVELVTGDVKGKPAPSGTTIPTERIRAATDLDSVLDVLDADTRTRMAIFINEAGTAFAGRKTDLMRILRELSPAIGDAGQVVHQLAEDNTELGQVLEASDRYVATVAADRKDVTRMIDRFAEGAETGATKQAQLRATLAKAPGSLRTLQGFLGELQRTTVPLGPAARQLSAASQPLRTTLDGLSPFTDAAKPALNKTEDVAPTLTELATKATPVLRGVRPTAAALTQLAAKDLPPVLRVTDNSIANTLAVLQNWSGAIQFRDSLSHLFRGEAAFAPDAIDSVVRRLAQQGQSASARKGKRPAKGKTTAPNTPASSSGKDDRPSNGAGGGPDVPKVVDEVKKTVQGVGKTVDDATKPLTDGLKPPGDTGTSQPTSDLLDFLLGS